MASVGEGNRIGHALVSRENFCPSSNPASVNFIKERTS